MMRMLSFRMFTFKCLSDEYCSKHRKNESLQKSHQHFDEINENGKGNGNQ